MVVHIVARGLWGQWLLDHPEPCWWLWGRLRETYPEALGACLMRSHLHLVTPVPSEHEAPEVLGHVLSGFTRRYFGRSGDRMWDRVGPAKPLTDASKVQRDLRYVALNPCRPPFEAVSDPLEWPWSTHRDVVGGRVDPWVSAERLASTLGRPEAGFEDWWHRHVSSDPSVSVEGTALPRSVGAADVPTEPLQRVVDAVDAALEGGRPVHRRRLVLALARQRGWTDVQMLSRATGLSVETVRKYNKRPPPDGLAAAAMCLNDARLRHRPARGKLPRPRPKWASVRAACGR